MIHSQRLAPPGKTLTPSQVQETLTRGLAGRFARQKVLVLIPDSTRSLPLPMLFRQLVEVLADASRLDFMVALGTHPPLPESALLNLVGITAEERTGKFRRVGLRNHAWEEASALTTLGTMEVDEIRALAGETWHASMPRKVEVRINTATLDADQVLIVGPTFPHEVAGFSGGAKYLFPGISGAEMINATHWLGALSGVVGTIGREDTPVRRMLHAAARRLKTPVTLAALTVEGHDISGVFVGGLEDAWRASAAVSAERHIRWCDRPYKRVLSCAPEMYDDLWTAAKAMYKLEPAVAPGGEVVLYAPHLEVVSHVHGKFISDVGYHILPYFLENWEACKHVPLGVLAHCTHVRGSGVMDAGVERPNVRLTLSSRIPAEDCARLNLGYLDPAKVDLKDWQQREEQGILYVPRAGEILYRVRAA